MKQVMIATIVNTASNTADSTVYMRGFRPGESQQGYCEREES